MAMTTRAAVLSFQLQMAEQSRKFGHRARERREELEREEPGQWQHKHVVARMHEHGDLAINTNQLSRYESGNGPFPREGRQEAFAYALKTSTADLIAGPLAERQIVSSEEEDAPDLSDALSSAEPASTTELKELLREVLDQQAQLLADVSQVRSEQERLSRQLRRRERDRGAKRKSRSDAPR